MFDDQPAHVGPNNESTTASSASNAVIDNATASIHMTLRRVLARIRPPTAPNSAAAKLTATNPVSSAEWLICACSTPATSMPTMAIATAHGIATAGQELRATA